MSTALLDTSDAIPLAFDDPRTEGEVVLFVHGFSHNRVVWDAVIEQLDERWRPIAVDLRGHGESDWSPIGRYALEDYARDLGSFVDAHDLRKIHVVGHSLGGNAATLFVADRQERIRSLSLIDTGPMLRADGAAHIADEVGESFGVYDSVARYRGQLAMIHPLGHPDLLERLSERSLVRRLDGRFEISLDPGVLGAGVSAFDPEEMEERLWAAVDQISCPVFVARGVLSSLFEAETGEQIIARSAVGSKFVEFDRAGHAVMIDAAEELGAQLEDFLSGFSPD